MNTRTLIAATLVAASTLAGCATTAEPPWLTDGGDMLSIRWVRAGPPRAEVQDGVCVLTFPDVPSGDVPVADSLARRCLEIGGLRDVTAKDVQHVRWHKSASLAEVQAMYADAYPDDRHGGFALGFYARRGETCHVVTLDGRRAFGHELKHCFDGRYHL